jgi:hypothetical protein
VKTKIPERVLVQYTVDFSEVPGRAKILLEELSNSFNGISSICKEIAVQCEEDPVTALKRLAQLKKLLIKSEIRTADISAILRGYLEILAKLVEERSQTAKEASPPPVQKKTKKKTKKKKSTKKKEE